MTSHLLIGSAAITPTAGVPYARKFNAKFSNKESQYVSLKDRIDQRIAELPLTVQNSIRGTLLSTAKGWVRKFPNKKTIADLDLCEAAFTTLSNILIDDTLQRQLDINWIIKILINWRDIQALPIMVYRPDGDEYKELCQKYGKEEIWAAWDGQHTAVALYIIAVWGLGLNPDEVIVPVTKYKSSTKAEMRINFTKGNSAEGKNLLDEIDLFYQMVYGVRLDGITDPVWVTAEKKFTALANADLFVTHKKFNNYDQPGAISRMKEINAFNVAVIQDFATYSKYAQAYGVRPVATMEMDIMCSWFDMARKDGIYYSEDEIRELADHMQVLFNGDFGDVGPFWEQARMSYSNWWDNYYSDPAYRPDKMVFKMLWSTGGVFLYYQLKHTWGGRIPKLTINSPFQPSKKDLF